MTLFFLLKTKTKTQDILGNSLSAVARLDTMVTVVDSVSFTRDVMAGGSLRERGMEADDADKRGVGDILLEQVFSHVRNE